MNTMRLLQQLLFVSCFFLVTTIQAQDAITYQMPPKEMADLLLAKPTPAVSIDSKAEWMLLSVRNSYPSVEELAMPEIRIAGLRINPNNYALSRQTFINDFTLKSIKANREFKITGLPVPLLAGSVSWSPNEKKIAFASENPALLKRSLQNLVANALAYTERGGVLVTARIRNDVLLLDVWDTGAGIAAAHLPRIFDEFYQIGNVSRDRRKGMGLGLAIVRRLVDLLGHPLEVTSRVDRGTRFRLRLPVAEAIESLASNAPMPLMDIRGKRALVVDDEPDVRDGMAAVLAARGCMVVVASSAREAIAKLAQAASRPDFAVMDYRLETQTGLAALADIRAHLGRHLPALIVTGDTRASDLVRFKDAGETWLIKPVSADDLQRAVTRLLTPANNE